MIENFLKSENGNSRDIITWVFCEECYDHDDAKRELPNYMTNEVKIIRVFEDFNGPIIRFNCQSCKTGKRSWKNKESRVTITANEFKAHPFLDPDYEPFEYDTNFTDQLATRIYTKNNKYKK
jgi:hypothetical protein